MPMSIDSKMHGFLRLGTVLLLSLLSGLFVPVVLHADPMRVTEDDAKKYVTQKVAPQYPPLARQLNLSGRVAVDMLVGESGSVEKVDVISGNPVLGSAAVTAAKRWRFQPFQADGKPAKALVRVNFDFTK